MPESTRKRSAAKTAAEPEPAAAPTPATKAAKAAKTAAKASKATKAAEATGPAVPGKPAKTAKPGKPAKAAKSAGPANAPEAEPPAADQDAGAGEGAEFLNRAARRAKGKGRTAGQQPVAGHGPSFSGRGAVPGQRQWGNRRTGG